MNIQCDQPTKARKMPLSAVSYTLKFASVWVGVCVAVGVVVDPSPVFAVPQADNRLTVTALSS